ncbi:hypothetical protein LCGC14_2403740 [marine sediment metagenome]|uniref:Uncharacterized protein n=1 Tax=marine sediment metagenome TaxID=412755 RepID=A0A0F9BUR1_9ZZZZ
MLEGWKCLECGVVYAPFIKECRCSAKVITNEEQVACFHNWTGPGTKCTKCGLIMIGGITFDSPPPTICQHIWSESGASTGGRYCLNCGACEPLFSPVKTTADEQGECKI